MGVWFLFEILLLISRGYIFRSGILDSYGNSVFNFEELPYCFPQGTSFILFIYVWLRWDFPAAHGLFSSCGAWLLIVGLPLLQGRGSRHTAFGSRSSRALEHRLGSCGSGV